MKKSKIIYIATISSSTIGTMLFFLYYYDPTPVTKENTFGINALVIHSLGVSGCPTEESCIYHDHYLKINSKLQTFLVGYNICDGNSCVKKDGLAVSLPVLDVLHPDYQKLQLPDNLPWKDGDSVNIQVKVPSASIIDNTLYFDASHPNIWVDLGKSEIVRSS
ncbi:MAG: hypothetical protein HY223_10440 [Thaumarchaeota archaeon]|nr:hypothetical protein [Nitrososphaerota archaeon]